MKKLMFAVAAIAAGAAVADVSSANIVGYSTREVKSEFRLFSVPFEKVGDETILINDCVKFDSDIYIDWDTDDDDEFEAFMDTAPQLLIQRIVDEAKGEEGTYQNYYYVKNAMFNDGGVKRYVPGWCDLTGKLATPEKTPNFPGVIAPGVSVVIRDAEGASGNSMTSPGQVTRDNVTIQCNEAFRMRAPALPMPTWINDPSIQYLDIDATTEIDWDTDDDDEFEAFMDTAPQLLIQRTVDEAKGAEGTYQNYYYVKNALFNDGGVKKYVPGWCDLTGKLATPEKTPNFPGVVPVNGGFYARGTGGFTIKYNIAE